VRPVKVLMSGATGFVGSHTAEALREHGFPVRALVRKSSASEPLRRLGVELVEGSLHDADALRRAVRDVDVVLHLAALTRARSRADYDHVNADGTAALVRAAVAAAPRPRRFVYLSSLAAAGPSANGRGVGPADTPNPLTAYGRSKLAGETIALAAADEVEVVILRAPAVYGPRDRDLYRFFRLAARGILPVPAGPARPLQLIHVGDLAEALVRAVTADRAAGIVHVAEATAYTWEEVARMVAEAVGADARVVRVPGALVTAAARASELVAAAFGRSTIFNGDKARELLAPGWLCETETARNLLGFEARIPLRDGLSTTAQWYREHGWLRGSAPTYGE
jgi:nucleoside-diphosphate-sugar epimerase